MPDNIQTSTICGIKCDAEQCDYSDTTVTLETLENWLNKPCPKCGSNLLTDEDLNNAKQLLAAMNFVNSLTKEEIDSIEIDPEVAKQLPIFQGAKGLEHLNDLDKPVHVTVDTHKEIKITEIKPI